MKGKWFHTLLPFSQAAGISLMLFTVMLLTSREGYNQQPISAKAIIKKSEDQLRGETSMAEVSIEIIRPTWSRTMKVKSWSKGEKFSMILVTAPVKDNGTVFLKRDKEVWNWVPSIERIIKLPPSMMTQSWMGTDFTNDDLVKESSVVNDYNQRITGDSVIQGRKCWKIEMIPLPQTAVVWGKVNVWVDQQNYLQLYIEFIDEENELVNMMNCSDIKIMGGRLLPTRMEMIPMDKPGNKTVLQYHTINFNQPIGDDFFTTQNMKKIK